MRRSLVLVGLAAGLIAAEPKVTEVTLTTSVHQNESVVAAIVRPATPAPGAPLVAFFPYPGQTEWAKTAVVRGLADAGFPLVGLHWLKQQPEHVDLHDRTKCAYYPESGAGAAWLDLIAQGSTGPSQPLFICGESGGGSMAAQFAAAYPEKVLAVAFTGGRLFPEKITGSAPWLVITSRRDLTEPANRALVARIRAAGAPVLYATTSPEWKRRLNPQAMFEHCPNNDSRALQVAYLRDLADLLRSSGGRIPPQSEWPASTESVLASEDQTPSGTQLRLPGPRTKAIWDGIQRVARPESVAGQTWLVREPGPATTPKGVVIATVSPDSAVDEVEWGYNLEYLVDRGLLVLEQRSGGDPAGHTIASLPAIAGTARYSKLPAIAVHVGPSLQTLSSVPGATMPKIKGRLLLDVWPAVRDAASTPVGSRIRAGETIAFVRAPERETGADQLATNRFVAAARGMQVIEERMIGESDRNVQLGRLRMICTLLVGLKIIPAPDDVGQVAKPEEKTPDPKPKPRTR